MATSTGESFEDGNEFTLWITDDRNRFRFTSSRRSASVRSAARLLKYENLKYPLDSKNKLKSYYICN